jgi:maltose alpha-D-glucosyltransferase/alpha-amylase
MTPPSSPRKTDKKNSLGTDPLWYKDAIIYEIHLKSFFDSNDDGIGDFRLDPKIGLPAEPRGDLPVVVAFLPFTPQGRRL